jgi:hypothetical protein
VPKIDWFDADAADYGDDRPRWEPRRRSLRLGRGWSAADWSGTTKPPRRSPPQFLPPTLSDSVPSAAPLRRPLHLIWGPPRRDEPR